MYINGISYNDSESVCEQYNGGHLASIHSGDENSFITSNISCNKLKLFSKFLGLKDANPWIGLYYNNKTNAFQWSDNTPVNYTNFNSSDITSNNTSTGLYCVQHDFDGWWYTRNCSWAVGFVCKTRPQKNNTLEYKTNDSVFLNIIEGNNQRKQINSYSDQDQCSNTCPTCVPDSCTPCPTLCNTKCPDGWTYYSATNFCYKVQLFTFQYIMSYI
jgi:hypothetical protein